MIDAAKLAEWAAMAEATTTGPWFAYENAVKSRADGRLVTATSTERHGCFMNAQFIAASRTAVPELIAEVRALQAERNDLYTAFYLALVGPAGGEFQISRHFLERLDPTKIVFEREDSPVDHSIVFRAVLQKD